MKSIRILAAMTLAAASLGAQAIAADDWLNSGFEDGMNGWSIREKEPMSATDTEAAHTGAAGLRVNDQGGGGAYVRSGKLPVTPGQEVQVTFWARTTKRGLAAVYLWFSSSDGKLVKDPTVKGGQGSPLLGVDEVDGDWHEYSLKGTAPDGAAAVSIWIHTFGIPAGTVDFDDFTLTAGGEGAVPEPVAEPKAENASEAESEPDARAEKPAAVSSNTPVTTAVNMPARAKPPIIVLKLDDLKQHYGGRVHEGWRKVADYLRERKIKAGFGVICQTLENADPKYAEWIRSRQRAGEVEFWFHAWDHAVHEENGVKYNEFNMRSYEEQKERVARSQRLAKEKLGFAFQTFGPPGGVGSGSFNEDTLRVMVEDPDIHVMLYPGPLNDLGRKTMAESGGKFVILDVLWQVRLERPLFKPNFAAFVSGYSNYPNREYFMLQGHPAAWNDEGFENFKQIIDFLVTEKAVFMTPTEAARVISQDGAGNAVPAQVAR